MPPAGELEVHLKANLKNVSKGIVNGRGRITIRHSGPDAVEHESGFRGQVPVQAGGNILFYSTVDAGIVQIKIGKSQSQFPCAPSFLRKMKIPIRFQLGKNAL